MFSTELAEWLFTGDRTDLAVWIGHNGIAVHSNRTGCAIPIKRVSLAHHFIRRFGLVKIETREDGILFAAP